MSDKIEMIIQSRRRVTPFSQSVIKWIRKIPRGRIASYGQIAKLAGKPNASRGVVWILNSSSQKYDLPWHRVLNSKGLIAFAKNSKNYKQQTKLLTQENIYVDGQGRVDLKKFQWKKRAKIPKDIKRKPQIFR